MYRYFPWPGGRVSVVVRWCGKARLGAKLGGHWRAGAGRAGRAGGPGGAGTKQLSQVQIGLFVMNAN